MTTSAGLEEFGPPWELAELPPMLGPRTAHCLAAPKGSVHPDPYLGRSANQQVARLSAPSQPCPNTTLPTSHCLIWVLAGHCDMHVRMRGGISHGVEGGQPPSVPYGDTEVDRKGASP